ncbi:MAG: N-acetyltransferase [Pseudomonadota bacterium]
MTASASELQIRVATLADLKTIRGVHLAAFPEEEREIVAALAVELVAEGPESGVLSLLAEQNGSATGSVVFSANAIPDAPSLKAYMLAPLGVRPDEHRGGVGSALVRAGLEMLEARGANVVMVYGDPKYYGRFGFTAELGEHFLPQHPLQFPFGWQAMTLGADVALPDQPVSIRCAAPLDDPALW